MSVYILIKSWGYGQDDILGVYLSLEGAIREFDSRGYRKDTMRIETWQAV